MALFLLNAFAFSFPFEINSTKHNPIVGYHPDVVYKLCLSEEATSLCLPPSPAFKDLRVQGAGSPWGSEPRAGDVGGAGRVSGEDCRWRAVPLTGKVGTVG